MPRFYFNLCNGAEFAEDEEGIELSDDAAARRKAVESLRGVMAGDLLVGDLNTASFIEVEDERHELIETVSFADVVKVRDEPHLRRASAVRRSGPSAVWISIKCGDGDAKAEDDGNSRRSERAVHPGSLGEER